MKTQGIMVEEIEPFTVAMGNNEQSICKEIEKGLTIELENYKFIEGFYVLSIGKVL